MGWVWPEVTVWPGASANSQQPWPSPAPQPRRPYQKPREQRPFRIQTFLICKRSNSSPPVPHTWSLGGGRGGCWGSPITHVASKDTPTTWGSRGCLQCLLVTEPRRRNCKRRASDRGAGLAVCPALF